MKLTQSERVMNLARHRGLLRSRDLEASGLPRVLLSRLSDQGALTKVGRGLYMPSDAEWTEHLSFQELARRVPQGVICLLSALSFHGIGTQLPRRIWIALESGARVPRLDSLPLEVVRQSGSAWDEGVETHKLPLATPGNDDVTVDIRVTSPAKTVADCFKFRSRVGMDVALEALSEALRTRKATLAQIEYFAEIDRVGRVMRPYLESVTFASSQR